MYDLPTHPPTYLIKLDTPIALVVVRVVKRSQGPVRVLESRHFLWVGGWVGGWVGEWVVLGG